MSILLSWDYEEFQFTHPGRGATASSVSSMASTSCFNSRTPGGVRLITLQMLLHTHMFQFTHPGRGATADRSGSIFTADSFNSRTPGGVRHTLVVRSLRTAGFNSRTPGGVRLREQNSFAERMWVSIHAPREGCDYIIC